ncbi:c-type cytochrome [Noviherbaspirillum aerium]|uniref:c-type cytochrome n=1 Tax=Noviherbaspirillum aerium TaxID=2588497 RepID=UPI001CEF66DC|nr:c-type cytochrome [Noviherbaspirillum aerium]
MQRSNAFGASTQAVRRVPRCTAASTAAAATLAALMALCGPAAAQGKAPGKASSAQTAAAAHSQRVAACSACHGADGNSQMPNSPSLAGQPKVFLENQLIVIREGLRVIPAMAGVLDKATDKEITALAEHFAAMPLKPQPGEKREVQFERGRVLASKMHCASCHLPNYEGQAQMPRIGGQREDYLVHSMREFKEGKAVGRDTIMASALYGVSDQDIQDLAHYLAHLK